MSARRAEPPPPLLLRSASRRSSVALLLVLGAGLGCVRTTSIGRASGPTDADADRDTGAVADRDVTPPSDVRADTLLDTGPIIGGGRDAATDGPDGPDAADGTGEP